MQKWSISVLLFHMEAFKSSLVPQAPPIVATVGGAWGRGYLKEYASTILVCECIYVIY